MCGNAVQQSVRAEVFVDIRPVHALAAPDEPPVCSLRRSRFRQSPRPRERDANVIIELKKSDYRPHTRPAKSGRARTVATLHRAPKSRQMVRRVRDLLASPLRLEAYGIAAADRATARYSWERISRETLAAYEHCLRPAAASVAGAASG